VPIPCPKQTGCEQAAQVEIARAVAKPAPHLHECITHTGRPEKVTDGKTLQCKATGKFVTADGDDVPAFGLVLLVVQGFLGKAVDGKDDKFGRGSMKLRIHLAPGHCGAGLLTKGL
jgi:hypothetical protein